MVVFIGYFRTSYYSILLYLPIKNYYTTITVVIPKQPANYQTPQFLLIAEMAPLFT
jgi:hypothetical protein